MLFPIICFALVGVCAPEMTASGIERELSEGVSSLGYKMVYGDEDMSVINEVVSEMEKSKVLKSATRLNEDLPPMQAADVKCLMSIDKYCSADMLQMKGILIHALKADCVKCTKEEKDRAGRIIASMLAHDPVAWKTFLTRSALQLLPIQEDNFELEDLKLQTVGEGKEVHSIYRYVKPGFNVRVKRFTAKKISSDQAKILDKLDIDSSQNNHILDFNTL